VTGWQLAMRSKTLYGPYEARVVMAQGKTSMNGPHQGAWVRKADGTDWFIHFQDVGVYGRIPHLQPVSWESGWPVMGKDGEPVAEGETHFGSPVDPASLSMSDTLCGPLKLHWQWQANPRTAWYRCGDDGLRLYAYPAPSLFEAGQFLSQLMQHRQFDMDITIRADLRDGDRAGIGMMGYRYSYLAIEPGCLSLWSGEATETTLRAPVRVHETLLCRLPYHQNEARVQMAVRDGMCSYAVYTDAGWTAVGGPQPMACGGWTSARPGIFCMNTSGIIGGSALFDSLEVTPR
jgi:beta-xylosidase